MGWLHLHLVTAFPGDDAHTEGGAEASAAEKGDDAHTEGGAEPSAAEKAADGGDGKTPSLAELQELDKRARAPEPPSATETAMTRSHESKVSLEPRVEGEVLELKKGSPLSTEDLKAIQKCEEATIALKQAIADERIEPEEMTQILSKLGLCAKEGSLFVQALFGPKASAGHFKFHGQLPTVGEKANEAEEMWEAVDERCNAQLAHALKNLSENTSNANAHAIEALAHAGSCMEKTGKAIHGVAEAHAKASESSCGWLPVPSPPRSDERRRQHLRCRTADFLAGPAVTAIRA
eukprot:gnl/TRDRNA2_/TRDRNA2_199292_c0_seq1.p1 gnl/TRDRNA2_/TRDRNA2_199292_c0~~gnl/TRDRNA2_/TRDRNA2_199292_c0_seq1.p1  ORF type:complete len:292 (-),score=75.07 gnl/TRDRNA2_/TRDRNA2_199292_c0_seq1:78-953(-)